MAGWGQGRRYPGLKRRRRSVLELLNIGALLPSERDKGCQTQFKKKKKTLVKWQEVSVVQGTTASATGEWVTICLLMDIPRESITLWRLGFINIYTPQIFQGPWEKRSKYPFLTLGWLYTKWSIPHSYSLNILEGSGWINYYCIYFCKFV